MTVTKEPQSLTALLGRLAKAREERALVVSHEKNSEKEAFTREIEKEANAMAAEFDS